MSLKLDIEEYPWEWSKELVAAVENYKNGERNSEKKLRKFVNREISEHYCNELIQRYAAFHRINKERKERESSQKIKGVLCDIVVSLVLLDSMACALAEHMRYGKGFAVLYFFLWLWSVDYAISQRTK